ncbi:MAG: hypothetical protein ACRCYQ_17210 [Nocardioides sp.]
MLVNVIVRDESAGGAAGGEAVVVSVDSATTVRDLIRTRVRDEVARYNAAPVQTFDGLVMPDGAEPLGTGRFLMSSTRRIDWEAQAELALDAFGRNQFFVLIDDLQVTEPDQVLDLIPESEIRFVRLVPLVGG